MKLLQRNLAEWLASEEPCLGAVFCTYNFDPAYFEAHVLRGVLGLRSDPEEQPAMFHEEARRALQEAPVAVIADASMRRAGRRLPYDLLVVHSCTFHPKLALVLYEHHARVVIGSCNLTRGGYEGNLELAFTRTLEYEKPEDALTLREVDRFLEQCAGLTSHPGTQLALTRECLHRRLPPISDDSRLGRDHRILSSLERPILDQFFDLIPRDAKVTRVGVLAPYFEADDTAIGTADGMASMLASMAERRVDGRVEFELGVSWPDAPLFPPAGSCPELGDRLGRLWAWRFSQPSEDGKRIEYLVPTALSPRTLSYTDALGQGRRWDADDAKRAHEEHRLWPVGTPSVGLPESIVSHVRHSHDLRLWLLPVSVFDEHGTVQRRPLHAKLFLVEAHRRGKARTYLLMGSPNASRGAMLRSVGEGGNAELAVSLVLDGSFALADLVPDLVRYDTEKVAFVPPSVDALPPNLGAWILDAVHDAAVGDLRVHWADTGPAPLGQWSLRYEDRIVAAGTGCPGAPTVVVPFELSPAIAELVLVAGGREASVPIRVADLGQLPTSGTLTQLGLRELLALLGRRVGAERLASLIGERGRGGADALLEAFFGEDFGPIDVFKAWWGIARELGEPLTVPGFKNRLRGPMGALAVWTRLRDAAGSSVAADEVWVYGCELARAFHEAEVPEGPDHDAKRALLKEFLSGLAGDVIALQPSPDGRPWIGAVASFYRTGARDA